MTAELWELDATAQADLLRRGEVAPDALVEAAIERIETLDPHVGAVVTTRFDEARAEVTAAVARGGPFAGVPILVKDAGQELAGEPHYVGVAALRDVGHRSTHTTELVHRFRRAGFVIVGRSSCPQLSGGINAEPAGFAPTRNPWLLDRTPGGSSGGSGAAVAAGMVPLAHGSDATGSLRFPAAWCGLFTLKATRGAIPVTVPAGGPDPLAIWNEYGLTRSVRDLIALWPILADVELGAMPATKARISLMREDTVIGLPIDESTSAAIDQVGAALQQLGYDVREASPPGLAALRDSAFPRHNSTAVDFIRARSVAWVEERLGRPIAAGDLSDIVLEQAARGRLLTETQLVDALTGMCDSIEPVATWFEGHDVLVTPVTHEGPPSIGASERFGIGVFCAPFSFTGQPAMSIPVGHRPDGTPVGIQLVGARGADALLLALASQLEAAGVARSQVAPVHVPGSAA